MFYAIHSTLNGIIPLLVVGIKGLMVLGISDLGIILKKNQIAGNFIRNGHQDLFLRK